MTGLCAPQRCLQEGEAGREEEALPACLALWALWGDLESARTSGGLMKKDIIRNKRGKYVGD